MEAAGGLGQKAENGSVGGPAGVLAGVLAGALAGVLVDVLAGVLVGVLAGELAGVLAGVPGSVPVGVFAAEPADAAAECAVVNCCHLVELAVAAAVGPVAQAGIELFEPAEPAVVSTAPVVAVGPVELAATSAVALVVAPIEGRVEERAGSLPAGDMPPEGPPVVAVGVVDRRVGGVVVAAAAAVVVVAVAAAAAAPLGLQHGRAEHVEHVEHVVGAVYAVYAGRAEYAERVGQPAPEGVSDCYLVSSGCW